MSDNLFQLAYVEKREALRDIERIISNLRSNMRCDAEAKIDLFLDALHGAALREARDAAQKASNEFWTDRVARHKTGAGAPFPLGVKLRKAKYMKYNRNQIEGYIFAVCEVYERGAPVPDNQSRPDPGDFILRYFKSDGKLGTRIEHGYFHGWEIAK